MYIYDTVTGNGSVGGSEERALEQPVERTGRTFPAAAERARFKAPRPDSAATLQDLNAGQAGSGSETGAGLLRGAVRGAWSSHTPQA